MPSAPLAPDTTEPVDRVAAPLEPEPFPPMSLDRRSKRPEPVLLPTPVATLTSPPVPVLEEEEPAEMIIEPPFAALDAPASRDTLPAGPPAAVPVTTIKDPDAPKEDGPVLSSRPPLGPVLLAPLPMRTPPLAPRDTPLWMARFPDTPSVESPEET